MFPLGCEETSIIGERRNILPQYLDQDCELSKACKKYIAIRQHLYVSIRGFPGDAIHDILPRKYFANINSLKSIRNFIVNANLSSSNFVLMIKTCVRQNLCHSRINIVIVGVDKMSPICQCLC